MDTDKNMAKGARGTAVAGLHSALRSMIWLLLAFGSLILASRPAEAPGNVTYIISAQNYLSAQDRAQLAHWSIREEKSRILAHFQGWLKEQPQNDLLKQDITQLLLGIFNIGLSAFDWDDSIQKVHDGWTKSDEKISSGTNTPISLKEKLSKIRGSLIQKFLDTKSISLEQTELDLILASLDYLGCPKNAVDAQNFANWKSYDALQYAHAQYTEKTPCHEKRLKKFEDSYYMHKGVNDLLTFSKGFHSSFIDKSITENPDLQSNLTSIPLSMANVLTSEDVKNTDMSSSGLLERIFLMNSLLKEVQKHGNVKKVPFQKFQNVVSGLAKDCQENNLSTKAEKLDLAIRAAEFYISVLKDEKQSFTSNEKISTGTALNIEDDRVFNMEIEIQASRECKYTHPGAELNIFRKATTIGINRAPQKLVKCKICQATKFEIGDFSSPLVMRGWDSERYYSLQCGKSSECTKPKVTNISSLDIHRKNYYDPSIEIKKLNIQKIETTLSNIQHPDMPLYTTISKIRFSEINPNSNVVLREFVTNFNGNIGKMECVRRLSFQRLLRQYLRPQSHNNVRQEKFQSSGNQNAKSIYSWGTGGIYFSIFSGVLIICTLLAMLLYFMSYRNHEKNKVELNRAS